MKTTLLFTFLIVSLTAGAQSVAGFYTVNTTTADHYSVVTSDTDLNESAAGASMIWNFNQLADAGTSVTNVNAPTAAEVTAYSGTTGVVATVFEGDGTTTDIYFSSTANGVAVTGAEASGFTLNYNTNNAYLGVFPLGYGYTNSDTVAGSFTSTVLSGTFTGTSVTSVDAYGTLSANIGGSWAGGTAVTRLKIVQNLNLIYLTATIGTVTQTTYQYYNNDGSAAPLFRSITTHIVLPAFNVDDTTSSLESYQSTLGTANFQASNNLAIAPNPVGDVLHFAGDTTVSGVTVIDASGRIVLQSKSANDIAVGNLSAGIYYVTAQSASGSTVQKMVKK